MRQMKSYLILICHRSVVPLSNQIPPSYSAQTDCHLLWKVCIQFAYMCVVQLYILYPALEVKYACILVMLPSVPLCDKCYWWLAPPLLCLTFCLHSFITWDGLSWVELGSELSSVSLPHVSVVCKGAVASIQHCGESVWFYYLWTCLALYCRLGMVTQLY